MLSGSKINESQIKDYLAAVTPSDVRSSLVRQRPALRDFVNFLSPAAAELRPEMRTAAALIKKRHFGSTVRLYSPLYISNYCINNCLYCGFRASHQAPRRRLTLEELVREAEIIHDFGINSLLLVSGEDPSHISLDYLESAAHKLKGMFSYIGIEIYPLSPAGYRRLFNSGIHGVTLYQETYNRALYLRLHKSGPKADYDKRLTHIAAAGEAGFYNLGLGVLLGLDDWRVEAVALASHALWLKKRFWQSRVQFSFPRITPIAGDFEVPCPVSEPELEQMILAFRLFFQEADLYLSTRESPAFRDRLAVTAASHLSAASRVVPGGYYESKDGDLGQFSLNDNRSVSQLRSDLKALGQEVIFKDWDLCFG